jgi:hypothetical protein
MRHQSGQNSENYTLLLLLQQDLVATGPMGREPHKFLNVHIGFCDIGAEYTLHPPTLSNRNSITH